MDLNKYLNETAAPETQYSKEEYAAMKKAEREAVWMQVDARMGEVLADAPALQEFLNFMSQSRNSLPNQLLLSGQNADITDARTFQQWKDAGRHIRTGEEGYTAIVGQVYENNGRKASGYNIGKVFDITQTRGRPVPPPAEYQVDELIAGSIESSPVPIQISDSLPDGIQAQYVPKNRTIYVRNGMDAGTTLCAIVRECAQADFHKDYTYNRQAYAAPSYCAAYMVAHRYGLDTAAFNFDRVVALYRNLGKDKFWEVIDNARAIAPALEGEPLRESLYKQLLKLSPDELVGFDCAWQEYRRIANSPQLIAAACIINGGTSDDRFDYFKNWLILQGQYVFRQALKDPDALAEFKIPFNDTEWEDCGYLTSLAFVGRALPTYFAQEGIAKELRRKYPALLQAPGALDAEIMRVLLYPNRKQEQAFDRYLLGLEVQHYIDISGLDSYDKFYLEHISCRWEWDYLRESIREETPQPRQGKLSPDIASTLPKLWKKRLAWDAEQRTSLHHRGEER